MLCDWKWEEGGRGPEVEVRVGLSWRSWAMGAAVRWEKLGSLRWWTVEGTGRLKVLSSGR